MKKDILYILIDMSIAIVFVLISLPVWQTQAAIMSELEPITDENSLTVYAADVGKGFTFKTLEKDVELSSLVVRNHSSISRTGTLVFAYSKQSNLDFTFLNIIINEEEMSISDFNYVVNDTHYIFFLDDFKIDGFSNLEYEVLVWVDSELVHKLLGQTINYYFDAVLLN